MKKILVFVCAVLFLVSFVSVEYAAADRIVNNNDGTVTDTLTGLMWADHDNGSDIGWSNAKSYCDGYSGGGKSGWRMPTIDELAQLDSSRAYGPVIRRTGYNVWASETRGYEVAFLCFSNGLRFWSPQSYVDSSLRALPVRSGK
jgi:hypothetical protein